MVIDMTKRSSKLSLTKETITTLDGKSLSRAQGGFALVQSSARCAAGNTAQLPNGSEYTTLLIDWDQMNGL